jgi:hypothetical protein
VGDPWLSIALTLCHILHSVSHWPVLVYFINCLLLPAVRPETSALTAASCHSEALGSVLPCSRVLHTSVAEVAGKEGNSFVD